MAFPAHTRLACDSLRAGILGSRGAYPTGFGHVTTSPACVEPVYVKSVFMKNTLIMFNSLKRNMFILQKLSLPKLLTQTFADADGI